MTASSPFARLFPDVPRAEFLRAGHRLPVVHHGPLARFGWHGAPAIDIESAIAGSTLPGLEVFFADPAHGEPTALNVPPTEAAKLYRLGATVELPLMIAGLSQSSDADGGPLHAVASYFHDLADELGLTVEAVMCLCSPGGQAVPMHFDRQSVFVLHLSGAKRWRLAPPSVESPTAAMFPTTQGATRSGAQPDYFPDTLPDHMPAHASQVEMTAGSALFLPMGYWHQTATDGPSVSVTMVPTCHSFLDLLMERVARLVENPEFRRPLFEILDPEREPADIAAQLTASLERAIQELRRTPMTTVLPFLPRRDRIRLAPGLTGEMPDSGPDGDTVVVRRAGEELISLDIDAEDRPFWRRLLDRDQPSISFADASARYSGSDDELSTTLRLLFDEGLIVRDLTSDNNDDRS